MTFGTPVHLHAANVSQITSLAAKSAEDAVVRRVRSSLRCRVVRELAMSPVSLIHLSPELLQRLPQQHTLPEAAPAGHEYRFATALALVAICAALAFALPV